MIIPLYARSFTLTFIAPAVALLPVAMPPRAQALSPAESVTLQAHFDPSLGSLRAGRVVAPVPFSAHERAELAAAQQQDTSLAALRGGSEPTKQQWTWIAIGLGVVLLIVLL